MRKALIMLVLLVLCVLCAACRVKDTSDTEEKSELDYTVEDDEDLPEEVANYITDRKRDSFSTTFVSGEYMYIIVCFGTMNTSGYSIQVTSAYETDNRIVIETKLSGPKTEGDKTETYPYIVLKTEKSDKQVVFK